ncbi:sigma factor [Demequina litorisediminis]|uniref:sigma factor n=1 Tax=Demequina litorisediminis TaxID=1849022 RepID=UPI0024E1478C|nr:sigma factor [Demequina litorisediminis]
MAQWRDTMEQLVRDRERALLSYAYLVCGDAVQAQDLVQDALVRTFSRERPGLTSLKAEGYVRRAITSSYVDGYRRQQRWQRVQHLFKPDAVAPDRFGQVEAGSDVTDALATLPPRVRACVVLRFFDDLTVPQIGRHRHRAGHCEALPQRWAGAGSWPWGRSRTRPSRTGEPPMKGQGCEAERCTQGRRRPGAHRWGDGLDRGCQAEGVAAACAAAGLQRTRGGGRRGDPRRGRAVPGVRRLRGLRLAGARHGLRRGS